MSVITLVPSFFFFFFFVMFVHIRAFLDLSMFIQKDKKGKRKQKSFRSKCFKKKKQTKKINDIPDGPLHRVIVAKLMRVDENFFFFFHVIFGH